MSDPGATAAARAAVPDTRLERSPFERRALTSLLLTIGVWTAAVIAGIPLVSVLWMLIVRGGSRLSLSLFTELPPAGFEMGGGFGNAIVGTVVMVGIAAIISIPVGVLSAVFLAELGPNSRLAQAARFATKTLTGLPSILAGVFAYAVVVLADRHLLGARRRAGPRGADAADGGAHRGGGHPGRPEDHPGRGLSAWAAPGPRWSGRCSCPPRCPAS